MNGCELASLPKVSVIMSVYNGAGFLMEAAQSILNQSERDFEFLIVNDGSTDGSGVMLDQLAQQDQRIRLFHQANQGLIASLNRMIAEARAPLIARMDADDIAYPDRLAKQLSWMNAHEDIAVLGSQCDDIDERGRRLPNPPDHPLDDAAIRARLDAGRNPFIHPSIIYRSAIIRKLGGYRSAFIHCEDYDLWLRLSEHYRLANLPDKLLSYRRSAGQVTNRHLYPLVRGISYAFYAHQQRKIGKEDPFTRLKSLPNLDQLGQYVASHQDMRTIHGWMIEHLKYSPEALREHMPDLIIRQMAMGDSLWQYRQILARMVKIGAIGPTIALIWRGLSGKS